MEGKTDDRVGGAVIEGGQVDVEKTNARLVQVKNVTQLHHK